MQAKTRLKNITKLNHANIQYKRKYFEGNVKKEIFCMKLIFNPKAQEHDFIRALIKMDKFHIFYWEIFQYGHSDNK